MKPKTKSLSFLSAIATTLIATATYAAASSVDMPYRIINVGEKYIEQGNTQVITVLPYLGGGDISGESLTVTNTSGQNLTLNQKDFSDSSKKDMTLTLDNGQSVSLPNSNWQLPEPSAKNTYFTVTEASGTEFCTLKNSPDVYYPQGNDLKVPRTNTTLKITDAGCQLITSPSPKASITITDPSNLFSSIFNVKDGVAVLQRDFTSSDWNEIKSTCPSYNNDENQRICQVTFSLNGKEAVLPVLINNGLRHKSTQALVDAYIDPTTGNVSGRDNLEISAQPKDFSGGDTKIVDLGTYFTDPSTNPSSQHTYSKP